MKRLLVIHLYKIWSYIPFAISCIFKMVYSIMFVCNSIWQWIYILIQNVRIKVYHKKRLIFLKFMIFKSFNIVLVSEYSFLVIMDYFYVKLKILLFSRIIFNLIYLIYKIYCQSFNSSLLIIQYYLRQL